MVNYRCCVWFYLLIFTIYILHASIINLRNRIEHEDNNGI